MQVLPTRLHEVTGFEARPISDEKLMPLVINYSAIDFYNTLSATKMPAKKNFAFFTPVLMSVLSMIHATAPGDVQAVMEKSMYMNWLPKGEYPKRLGIWLETLCKTNGFFKMKFGTLVLTAAPFSATSSRNMQHCSPSIVIFNKADEAQTIGNNWVAELTENKIPKLLDSVPAELAYLLMSAALFDGKWEKPFTQQKRDTFYSLDGSKKQVPMMNIEDDVMFGNFPQSMRVMRKDYKGQIGMYFISPLFDHYSPIRKAGIEERLTAFMTKANLQGLLDNPSQLHEIKEFELNIPKFEMKDQTDYLEELKDTEMGKAFKEGDFRGAFAQDPGRPVRMAFVQSEVNVKVDEAGTQIAAAAAVGCQFECMKMSFDINGPFGMMMVDLKTNTIMFMGQILNYPS